MADKTNLKWVLFLLILGSTPLLAEIEKVTKVTRPLIVTINRDDFSYTRLFAVFKTPDDACVTGIKITGKAVPPLDEIVLDTEKLGNGRSRTKSDGGETISENALLPQRFYDSTVQYKFKPSDKMQTWEALNANKITVSVPSKSEPKKMLTDEIYFVTAISRETGEKVSIICDDVTDLKTAFNSRFTGEPATIADKASTVHAATVAAQEPINHPEAQSASVVETPGRATAEK